METSRRRWSIIPFGGCLGSTAVVGSTVAILVGLSWYVLPQRTDNRIYGIMNETANLNAAMMSYKADHRQFPPDLSDVSEASRRKRFEKHIGLTFPRCGISYTKLRDSILNNSEKAYGYNILGPESKLAPLDLDTLDQAEALVFWLGGFPTPRSSTGVPLVPHKLIGFHTDVTNPFRLDLGTAASVAYRTTSLLDFDESRLVDSDQDGWWEYIPPGNAAAVNGKVPPYVYFDAGGYTQPWQGKTPPFVGYPMPRQGDPNSAQATQLMKSWGIAVPYAQSFENPGMESPQWLCPKSFQIVSAGVDGAYGPPNSTNVRIPCFSSGATFAIPSLARGDFDARERDNIANFSQRTIGGASASQ